jgi:hypothetical protein
VGKPEDAELFVPVQLGEWGRRYGTIYVAREIWERLRAASRDFTFYVQEGGRCRIHFDQPIGRLQV